MVHVCYALHDPSGKYSKFLGISMQSLLKNTNEEVTIHLLHDSTLKRENRRKLCKLVYTLNSELFLYDVDKMVSGKKEEIIEKIPQVRGKFSVATLYRTLIPSLLPREISKIIYLDADTVVNLDIAEFWKVNLENFPLAAVPQVTSGYTEESLSHVNLTVKQKLVKWDDYFNAGVLVMNLNRLRIMGGGHQFTRSMHRCINETSRETKSRSRCSEYLVSK